MFYLQFSVCSHRACLVWARRVLPLWRDLTRLLFLFLSLGWWRWHIDKFVGTEEARLPCTSGNAQLHSPVRWTCMCSLTWQEVHLLSRTLDQSLISVSILQYDPFAEHRAPKIADREDEYKARRRQMIISPERLDPFADGKCHPFLSCLDASVSLLCSVSVFFVVLMTLPRKPVASSR